MKRSPVILGLRTQPGEERVVWESLTHDGSLQVLQNSDRRPFAHKPITLDIAPLNQIEDRREVGRAPCVVIVQQVLPEYMGQTRVELG